MKADDIITTVENTLLDPANQYWSSAELLSYINDAQRQVVNFRPGANAVVVMEPLVAGTRQTLPPGATALIDLARNAAGASITAVDRRDMDRMVPDWPTQAGSNTIQHYMYDDRAPNTYMVYPPALAGAQVEVIYSATLADVAGTQDELTLGEQYRSAIIEYVLYRAHTKDTTAAVPARAQAHYQLFMQILGVGDAKLAQQAAGEPDPNNPRELR